MDNAIWVKCNGEAHSPAVAGNIDHCMICMPYWEHYPVCPKCKVRVTEKGFCHNCRNYCNVKQNGM